jgi:hypothetical protein
MACGIRCGLRLRLRHGGITKLAAETAPGLHLGVFKIVARAPDPE